MDLSNKKYKEMAEKKSPPSPIIKNCIIAFLIGGAICALGQGIINFFEACGMEFEDASCIASCSLVFLSVLLTGLNIYGKIAKHAGAGTLVPITGFANAVAAPALEFKSEGLILGLGAKMFVIAGPVIVYGVLSSVLAGIIKYIMAVML